MIPTPPRDEVLAYETRRRLFALIGASLGLHLRELARLAAMPLSTIRYHVDYLERRGLLDVRDDKRCRRSSPRGGLDDEEREIVTALRQAAPRRVVLSSSRATAAPRTRTSAPRSPRR